MKTLPILMSSPMVRALLNGTKTQTRRAVRPQPKVHIADIGYELIFDKKCNKYKTGLTLWVRENFIRSIGDGPVYRADLEDDEAEDFKGMWTPSIFMPRNASRLTLKLTEVRVKRLQDINEDNAIAEGIVVSGPLPELPKSNGNIYSAGVGDLDDPYNWTRSPIEAYRQLWESINGKGSWDANPWVWALSFRVHRRNVDAFLKSRVS